MATLQPIETSWFNSMISPENATNETTPLVANSIAAENSNKSIKDIIVKKREFLAKHRKTLAQLLLLSKKHNFHDKLRNIELMVKCLQNDDASETSLRLLESYENYLNNLKFNLFPSILINSVRTAISMPVVSSQIFHRTFGSALARLNVYHPYHSKIHGPTSRKRMKCRDNHSIKLLSLQKELVSLDHKFKLDYRFSRQQLALPLWLLVRVDHHDLPSFPPIALHIFDNYPEVPARLVLDPIIWNGSPLFAKVFSIYQKDLLNHTHSNQSIQAVLNVWYVCIQKAIRTFV